MRWKQRKISQNRITEKHVSVGCPGPQILRRVSEIAMHTTTAATTPLMPSTAATGASCSEGRHPQYASSSSERERRKAPSFFLRPSVLTIARPPSRTPRNAAVVERYRFFQFPLYDINNRVDIVHSALRSLGDVKHLCAYLFSRRSKFARRRCLKHCYNLARIRRNV